MNSRNVYYGVALEVLASLLSAIICLLNRGLTSFPCDLPQRCNFNTFLLTNLSSSS